jgi:hypothetical protein
VLPALVAQRVIEPLSADEEETRSWNLYELASLVEGQGFQSGATTVRLTKSWGK